MTYKIQVGGVEETHTNRDDVIIALVAYLNGYNIGARVEWPDGFVVGAL